MRTLKSILVALLILAGLFGAVFLDFKIWSLQHPGAPTWTYLFR